MSDSTPATAARSSDGGDLHEGYDGYYEGREPLSAYEANRPEDAISLAAVLAEARASVPRA